MTAELAIALPAVVVVLVTVLLVVMAGVAQLRAADAARAGARAVAVGEGDAHVEEVVRHVAGPEARVQVARGDPWVVVHVEVPVGRGWAGGFVASASATAWLESALTGSG